MTFDAGLTAAQVHSIAIRVIHGFERWDLQHCSFGALLPSESEEQTACRQPESKIKRFNQG